MKNYLATLHDMTPIPQGSVYRGNGKFDFYDEALPANVKEKLKEVNEDGTVLFAKPGEMVKASAELKKEGKPIHKPPKVKAKEKS